MSQSTDNDTHGEFIRAMRDLETRGEVAISGLWKAALEELHAKPAGTGAATWASAPQPDSGVKRTRDGILVSSKKLVMQVYLNAAKNYSVDGYRQRMAKTFGEIYLGMDEGPDYWALSRQSNAAIMAISEAESFAQALGATREYLRSLDDPAGFDPQKVSDNVLAALCRHWFGLPDDIHVLFGGFRLTNVIPPARCPGDFGVPSGYIFHPDPGFILTALGQELGKMLRSAVGKFVAAHRDPANPPQGALAKAMFAAFPNPEQNDLLARTMIGVMVGLLPTVDGNLVTTLKAWRRDAAFADLQRKFKASAEPDLHKRAGEILRRPLMLAMQASPVPDAVWRTAVKDHTLGDSNPVEVHAGDKIYVSIVSATHEDLAKDVADVYPIFGGDRSQDPSPLHACPGYKAAMGILLGTAAGTMSP
jgi:hypothetical protein